jgi:hypothetical protein
MHVTGTRIVYPAAEASEATSSPDQSLQSLQAVLTQPLPDSKKATPSKRKGSGHGMMIVICDEMDQLMSNAQEVLYDLFFLPQVSSSPCHRYPLLLATGIHSACPCSSYFSLCYFPSVDANSVLGQ